MKHTVIIDGEPLELELSYSGTHVEAEISGRKYVLDAIAVETGVYWLNWNNRSIEVAVTGAKAGYTVSLNGQRFSIEVVDPRAALRRAAKVGYDGAFELRAPMPGKVVKVLVAENAHVETNQGILVIEAMKMQNELKSPKKGVVRRLAVKEAAAVNAGDVLAIVE
jgi:biotin carboxyl carrier protein